jgi:hypothetical protein
MSTINYVHHWIWARLDVITGVLLIPWGMFLLSLALVGWKRFTKTSGADVFVILSSLDLEFIVFKDRFVQLVYPGIQSKFNDVFAIGLVFSVFWLIVASRVQAQITDGGPGLSASWGHSTALFMCWFFALAWMAIHFFVILAR